MLRKPHWTLGLELGPQHFQFQDQYHEDLVARRFETLFDYAWGISEIEWDVAGIAAGHLTLKRLEAILPDGTLIACGTEEAPSTPSIVVRDLGKKDSLEISVAVPRARAEGMNVDVEGQSKQGQRYTKEAVVVPDFASGAEPIRVEWLRPNVRLLLEGDRRDDHVTLACGRLIRTAAGALAFDETFIPPIVSIRASSFIQSELRRIVEGLMGRRAALKRPSSNEAGEAARRWLLGIIGSFIPRVADLVEQRRAHPLVAYRVLAELLGGLSAFTRDGESHIPAFDHDHLGPVFSELFGNLSVVLDALGAEHHRRIPLQRYDDTTFFAELKEPAIFRNDFFLGVAGSDVEAIRTQVPRHFKIAAWTDLSLVVRTATAGVPLQVERRPPSTLPDGAGVVYFRLEKTDAFTPIFKSGQLGIYHTAGLEVTDVALFVVEPEAP